MNKKTLIPIVVLAVIIAFVAGAYFLDIIGTPKSVTVASPVKAQMIKVVRTYRDVAQATKLTPDGSDRKLMIAEIPAGTEIQSIVTNIADPFVLPGNIPVYATSVRAERRGLEVSSGDLAAMPALDVTGISGGRGSANEFGLYSLDEPVSIMFRIQGGNATDLSTLRSGVIEFYITVVSL